MNHGPASEEAIRIEAFILSEQAGHPSGRDHLFWQEAEAIIHKRLAAGLVKPARGGKAAAVSTGKKPEAPVPNKRKSATTKAPSKAAKPVVAEQPELPVTIISEAATAPVAKRPLAKRPSTPRKR